MKRLLMACALLALAYSPGWAGVSPGHQVDDAGLPVALRRIPGVVWSHSWMEGNGREEAFQFTFFTFKRAYACWELLGLAYPPDELPAQGIARCKVLAGALFLEALKRIERGEEP